MSMEESKKLKKAKVVPGLRDCTWILPKMVYCGRGMNHYKITNLFDINMKRRIILLEAWLLNEFSLKTGEKWHMHYI